MTVLRVLLSTPASALRETADMEESSKIAAAWRTGASSEVNDRDSGSAVWTGSVVWESFSLAALNVNGAGEGVASAINETSPV